jgi:hypothetical protein
MSRGQSFGFYCSCGGAMTGFVKPATRIPEYEATFRTIHTGSGHEPTTSRKAATARRKANR